MRFVLWFFFFITTAFSFSAFAENHLIFFGGGDTQDPGDAMFDRDLKNALEFYQKEKWNGEFFWRRALPQSGLKEGQTAKIQGFTPASFKRKIDKLIEDIENGKITSKDQVLVYVSTHGELTKMNSLNWWVDRQPVDAAQVQKLIDVASEKGVRLGLAGMSCYAGSLIKYQKPNVCIVTASQPDKVGNLFDSRELLQFAVENSGKTNLEEAFLHSRKTVFESPTQPMISSEAGIIVDEILAPLKKGIFAAEEDLISQIESPECKNFLGPLNRIKDKIGNIRRDLKLNLGLDLVVHTPFTENIYKSLEKKMSQYARYYEASKTAEYTKNKTVCRDSHKKVCLTYEKLEQIIETDGGYCGAGFCDTKLWLEYVNKNRVRNSEDYIEFKKRTAATEDNVTKMLLLSYDIAKDERELYNHLYKQISEKLKDSPNPCRDFKL